MDHPPPPTTQRQTTCAFLLVVWGVWLIAPERWLAWMFFFPSYSHGAFHGGTPQPPITANAFGLAVLLLASQRWSGWRTKEFWIMLSYFCLFAVAQLMIHALTAMDENSIEALTWPTLALFVCTAGCALALPGLTIVRWLRSKLSNP